MRVIGRIGTLTILVFAIIGATGFAQTPAVSVTTGASGLQVVVAKTYGAKTLAEQRYWYEDGSPMGTPRPTFSAALPDSVFVAVRARIRVSTDPIQIDRVRLTGTTGGDYRPVAIKPMCPADDARSDFVFKYDPGSQWFSARHWTSLAVGGQKVDSIPNTLLLPNAKDNICVELVYETPASSKSLVMKMGG